MSELPKIGNKYLGPASEFVEVVSLGWYNVVIRQLLPKVMPKEYVPNEHWHRLYKPIEAEKVVM